MDCQYCLSDCKKDGKQSNGVQKYRCRNCRKYQQKKYLYKACHHEIKQLIPKLMTEGCSYSGLARGLKISRKTITKLILEESRKITRPVLIEQKQRYEMDEVQTYIKKNEPANYVYIAYALNRVSKLPVELMVGRRTSKNLEKVTQALLQLCPKRIYTDGLPNYRRLIPEPVHRVSRRMTVHIERMHLNIRTRIRAMQRKTICYSKSLETLTALITILFWGNCISSGTD